MFDYAAEWPEHTKIHRISVAGGYITAFEVLGKDLNAVPLVVVHGGPGGSCRSFRKLLPDSDMPPVTMVFYDQLGSHYSRLPESTNNKASLWQLDRFSAELEAVIDSVFGTRIVSLFGHSWGGALAAIYAAKNSYRVHRLHLSSPLYATKIWLKDSLTLLDNFDPKVKSIVLDAEKDPESVDTNIAKAALDLINAHHFLRTTTAAIYFGDTFFNASAYHTMWGKCEYSCHGNLQDLDLTPILNKIACKTLITCGRYDMARPDTMKKICNLIPHSTLHVFESSGHVPHCDERNAFLKTLYNFVVSAREHDNGFLPKNSVNPPSKNL